MSWLVRPFAIRRSRFWIPIHKEQQQQQQQHEHQHQPEQQEHEKKVEGEETEAQKQSISQGLSLKAGLMHTSGAAGLWNLLPLGQRVYEKIERVIDAEMEAAGGQKVSLSTLQPPANWHKTGRWQQMGKELFQLEDRKGGGYCLAPTHEECITSIVADLAPSRQQLPLLLYQIGRKYRDEPRPRAGLLRAREFVMKDLYSFDENLDHALLTYHRVKDAYVRIFRRLQLPVVVAAASGGAIGGSLTHEFHVLSAAGEDTLCHCPSCRSWANSEVLPQFQSSSSDSSTDSTTSISEVNCQECGKKGLTEHRGIEVGHTFLLDTKYSAVLEAQLGDGKPYAMGCFGIGLTRIMAAAIEVAHDDKGIRWPAALAPFKLAILTLGPATDQQLNEAALGLAEQLCRALPSLQGDILWDDTPTRPGHKLTESELIGYPLTIVIGSQWKKSGLFEVRVRASGQVITGLSCSALLDLVSQHLKA